TDRAYTVPQIYDWVEGAGLMLSEFFGETTDDSLYTPQSYTNSADVMALVTPKTAREHHTIAELMNGNIAKHYFYASKQPKAPAQFEDDMVIAYGPMMCLFNFVPPFVEALKNLPIGQRVDGNPRPFNAPILFITRTRHVVELLPMIDGVRSIGTLVAQVAKASGAPVAEVRADLETLYKELRTRQTVFLRHESLAPYKTGPEITARVRKYQGRA
ncbi:MAG: hypothetical protein ACOYNL_08995, partial [Rickettsiales bacterium]